MNVKEFTLQKGFNLPVLKVLEVLNSPCILAEIFECLMVGDLIYQTEADIEKVDFSGKRRFEHAVEACINNLVNRGLVEVIGDVYSITRDGITELNEKWQKYSHREFIRKVDITRDNKYIYFNIPEFLTYRGAKQVSMLGFEVLNNQQVKHLNDFIDYIDLNYPTIDEMIKFLKYNYDIEDTDSCVNAINITRRSGLVKVMGKNLSLTKLGLWYINSYNNIALFKIFANRFLGFEDIFRVVAYKSTITSEDIRNIL